MAKRRSIVANTQISMIEAALLNQEMAFMEYSRDLFQKIIEAHTRIKFLSGDDTELLGDATMFKILEKYQMVSISDGTKAQIMKGVIAEFPQMDLEWRKERCQLIAYNMYLTNAEQLSQHIKPE